MTWYPRLYTMTACSFDPGDTHDTTGRMFALAWFGLVIEFTLTRRDKKR